MSKKYQTVVVIGRFQPVHNAHVKLIAQAAELGDQVIVIIGSDKQPRTYKNPFTSAEREGMIKQAIHRFVPASVVTRIERNIDTIYNDEAWVARVQAIVAKHTATQTKIAIIGHHKDESTAYLEMFPQWSVEEIDLVEPLNATDIRDLYFRENCNMNFIRGVVPASTFEFLDGWRNSEEFHQIIRERSFVEKYRAEYAHLKYPPVFITGDAIVTCCGHVLMVKRRAEPGKGLWAFPGGYMNANSDKSVTDVIFRELLEETKIKVPEKVLRGSVKRVRVFDAINRSPRGRIVTHAALIQLADTTLPHVKGSDDAEKAQWIPFASVDPSMCFEDHYEIFTNMVGV